MLRAFANLNQANIPTEATPKLNEQLQEGDTSMIRALKSIPRVLMGKTLFPRES